MDVSSAISQVPRISWDTPYRAVASLMGLATLAVVFLPGIARPSDAVDEALRWIGLDLSNQVDTWSRWIAAPERHIAGVAVVLMFFALLVVAATAVQRAALGGRAAATALIGLGLYLQARGDAFADWQILLLLLISASWLIRKDPRAAERVLGDLGFALSYSVLIPLMWSLSSDRISDDRE